MGYWKSPQEMGLTQDEIDKIVNQLWTEHNANAETKCHDCGVSPSEKHKHGCDVARCVNCGGQCLSCDCDEPSEDMWTGLWPGIKECYEQKLITKSEHGNGQWMFDLNTLATQSK